MAAQGVDQPSFSEFFAFRIEALRYTIRVECHSVTRRQSPLAGRAVPAFEESENRASGLEARQVAIFAEKKSREMAAVRIAKAAGLIVVLREEERSESTVGGVFVEQAIYREQKSLGLLENKWHVRTA